MKTLLIIVFNLISCLALAQPSDSTLVRSKKNQLGYTEKFTELKSKPGVKNGMAHLFYKDVLVGYGLFKDNQRAGKWRFFKSKDSIEQIFNFDLRKAEYNRPMPNISYVIEDIKDGDRVVKPIKIGGYKLIFRTIFLKSHNSGFPVENNKYKRYYIFSIDDLGNLISLEEKVSSPTFNTKITKIDLRHIDLDHFKFLPAELNGKTVSCKVVWELDLTVHSN